MLAAALCAPALAPAAAALAPPAAQAPAVGTGCVGQSGQVTRTTPWAQSSLDPAAVWALTQGSGQLVAVLGSGVSAAAPALAGAVLPGRDVLTGGPADTDCLGAGTFAAGIIAARQVPGSAFAGLAPAARILPVTVTGSGGRASPAAVAAGIRYAVASGASVVDAALPAPPGPSPALLSAVRYARAANVVVVAPVATSGLTSAANQLSFPADYPGVIAVCAVGRGGAPVSAGTAGVRVDLAAPGAQVVSTAPLGTGDLTTTGAWAATAFVAAAAALVRGYYPRLSAGQVVHRLEVTADRPGITVPDWQLGYGTVDPYAAVTAVLPEEWGVRPPARDLPPPRLPARGRPGTWPLTAALLVLGGSAALVTAVAAGIGVIRHGRRRGWQPAG
jgi:hypothetical protein